MPYADPEKHRQNAREWVRKHPLRAKGSSYRRYHNCIGTWTAKRLGMSKADYDARSRSQGPPLRHLPQARKDSA